MQCKDLTILFSPQRSMLTALCECEMVCADWYLALSLHNEIQSI